MDHAFDQSLSSHIPPPFAIRTRTDNDAELEFRTYLESRDELCAEVLSSEVHKNLLKMQHNIFQNGIETNFPEALHLIIQCENIDVGRLILDETAHELRVVDLSVMKAYRRRHIAHNILRAVIDYALSKTLPTTLSVSKSNQAALNLYRSIGFATTSENEIFLHMRCPSIS